MGSPAAADRGILRTGLTRQQDSAIPGRRRGARVGACGAAAEPRARSGAAASRPQQVGPAGGAGIGVLLGSRCGASELGLSRSLCNHFPRWQPGATGLRFAHFARRGAAGIPRPPLSLKRARSGGGRPGADKGREGGGGARPGPQGGAARTRAYL